MSGYGYKRTFSARASMSALGGKADLARQADIALPWGWQMMRQSGSHIADPASTGTRKRALVTRTHAPAQVRLL